MNAGSFALPEGRRGQALAVGLTLLALAVIWLAVGAPLTGWYEGRAAALAQQRALAARMVALGREIPALRAAVAKAGLASAGNAVLLPGGTDAIAGADLQSALQNLATQAGTSLDSAALVAPQQSGALRRIGLQVSVTTTWPVLIALLQAIDAARPRMIVDGLNVTATSPGSAAQDATLQANFTVAGFRAGAGP